MYIGGRQRVFFKILEYKKIFINSIKLIKEHFLAILETNEAVEKTFSITNVLWTKKEIVPIIKAFIILKTICYDFYDFLSTQPKILNALSL